ncbi:MAG: MBL fold metallo-hydrolase [Bacteroidetes bacterium]|nr:MAG: MBL fold metallo-hydrolase [Bacteroidota bacterium]
MIIQQFEDKGLAHFGYAILDESAKKVVLIDPARDPKPYYEFAEKNQAKITNVIETHPHADFVSSHYEISQETGASIHVSKLLGAEYPHQSFDEGDQLNFSEFNLKCLHTPGHSPDSICILLESEGKNKAIFTGDTLFIGDCGRPDLRESVGNIRAKREELAKQMYHSLHEKLTKLEDNVLVYPAHGAGSLCGKALCDANSSTIGAEKIGNWSMKPMPEADFVTELTSDQPFIPKYFVFDVNTNKKGAEHFAKNISAVKRAKFDAKTKLESKIIIIDARPQAKFNAGHLPNSINLQNGGKFETWLGSIVSSDEKYYLMAETEKELEDLIIKTSKIGYEKGIETAFVMESLAGQTSLNLDLEHFRNNPNLYTIVDIRNENEVKQDGKKFANAINIPLPELRERANELPLNQAIMVHCAGGYRSAAGQSILANILPNIQVFDLSENIKSF